MLIELKGVQFVNKGAELMLEAMLSEISKRWPNADICMQPRSTASYSDRARVGAYQKVCLRKGNLDFNKLSYFLPEKIRSYLKRAWGLVFEADVDVVFDATGFGYGDQWPVMPLKQTAKEVRRLKQYNKHYVFLPQALGPFERAELKPWAKIAFDNATKVYAREATSYQYVRSLSDEMAVAKQPDFTNTLLSSEQMNDDKFNDFVAIIPNSKMLSSKNKEAFWRENYEKVLKQVIEVVQARGHQAFFLNHEGQADLAICHRLNKELENPLEIIEPKSALHIKQIIGQCKFVFCSRYHGCVSALSQSIPCLGTSWSHKYEELYQEYGVSHLLLQENCDKQNITQLVDRVLETHNDIANQLKEPASKFKLMTEEMWAELEVQLA